METLFDRPQHGERALLVHIDFYQGSEPEDLDEFEMLVESAGAEICGLVKGSRHQPDSRLFIGSGKAEEIALQAEATETDLVIFNHTLSASQERNLEKKLNRRVLDRTGLILDIFAQRARTFEGKLQVELAQLEHLSTRLIRGWTHLERQKGGIGLRGPGETQLETDRRLLRERIKAIHKRLEKVRKQRDQGRRSRRKAEIPTVSLVGYTNAGKSTLFNRLTDADVYVQDQLFATLDPTLRSIEVADVGDLVMADTVGFISHLPHKLVEAFRATLEESREADLLLHVVDACSENREGNMFEVRQVLKEIAADSIAALLVYNKIDLMGDFAPRLERDASGKPRAVWLSAKTGAGIELLYQALSELLVGEMAIRVLRLTPQFGHLRALFYEHNAVQQEEIDEQGNARLQIRLAQKTYAQLLKKLDLEEKDLLL